MATPQDQPTGLSSTGLEAGATQPTMDFTPVIEAETAHLYERVRHVVPEIEWAYFAPLVHAINQLKTEKRAVILAHNYMTPEIFNCVGDYLGDSLGLAREAARTSADVIVQAGVHFMAETAKILSPDKTVLIPDLAAGCSLAASITGSDVRLIKERYPGIPVVTYVNTTAEVKAESDITCTSANAKQVVETMATTWGVSRVVLLPDEYLARNVAAQTDIDVVTWSGRCEVHEQFTARDIEEFRETHPGVVVLAHPECSPDVLRAADFAGSTSDMSRWVSDHQPRQVVLVTECSMSDNVAVANPGVDFVRPCNLCPHMKRITLQNIYDSLRLGRHEVTVAADVAEKARDAIQRMLDLPPPAAAAQFDPRAEPAAVTVV